MRVMRFLPALALLVFAGFPQLGFAAPLDGGDPAPDTGDTGFMIVASALVLFMTPGLAFFYGGLVRRKNILSVPMQCFMCMCLMTVLWVIVGYSLAFGGDIGTGFLGGWIGKPMQYLFLKDVNGLSGTIPHLLFMAFQGMFAIITPALILGAFAERVKFSGFCVFMTLWLLLVYCPVCHWVWGGAEGFFGLGNDGALDFAGGTVVHINAGIAALVLALVIGKRKGYPSKISPPHNLPFAVLGAGMLWFGWFGFNAGSELAADYVAVNAFTVTQIAAAMAGLTWAIIDRIVTGKATMLGMITGAVAGLVAITPACGAVNPMGALGVGAGASICAYFAVAAIKEKLGYDDSLDVFGVHGVAGIWGALAAGLWATADVTGGAEGFFYNQQITQLLIQAKAVIYTIVYSGVVSFILAKIVQAVVGLRADEDAESVGMDLSDHAEHAYTVVD
jgi:Amt family ammonium transporter